MDGHHRPSSPLQIQAGAERLLFAVRRLGGAELPRVSASGGALSAAAVVGVVGLRGHGSAGRSGAWAMGEVVGWWDVWPEQMSRCIGSGALGNLGNG